MQTLKAFCQSFLRNTGLYHRVKASCLYDLYWRMADQQVLRARRQEIDFYRSVLEGFAMGDLIFDIGANEGYKTDVFLRLGAKVIAVDPDESNQEALDGKFLKCRFVKRPVTIVGKAVSDRDAVETMWVDQPGSAKNTMNRKWVETLIKDKERFGNTFTFTQRKSVETITIESLIAAHGFPFFIKIDVEGYEVNVIRGMCRPVPFLSFEVNLPEFRSEGSECIQLLGTLSTEGRFNYAFDYERGLALKEWMNQEKFLEVFRSCKEKSIEVFWKTPIFVLSGN